MPHIALIDHKAPLGKRFAAALVYPFRDAALYSMIGLALAHYVILVPLLIGALLLLVVWAMTFVYASACLRHTADGYADPPEPMDDDRDSGWAIVKVLLLAILLLVLARAFTGPGMALLVGLALAFIVPAIILPLAFGDDLGQALNPGVWLSCMARIGPPYLLLAGALMIAWLVQVHARGVIATWVPTLLAIPLSGLISTYAVIVCFHLMGILVHRHHEALGMQPEAPKLAKAGGQDADEALLDKAQLLDANGQGEAARTLLRERIDARSAAPALHLAYRTLLRGGSCRDELLTHADPCLFALLQAGDARRALGVVRECVALDPDFMPGDPDTAGNLAEAAERAAMPQLALKLARGYPNTWPKAPAAAHYGLMAARLIANDPGRRAEAAVLASKLQKAFPDSPEQSAITDLLRQLQHAAS